MKKKHAIIFLVIISLVIGLIIVLKVSSDLNKESKLKAEIREISKVFTINNVDNDQINEILERRVIKKGDYADIEISIKKYYKNIYSDLKNLNFLLDEDNFANYLSGKNIKEDGPNFLKSRSNLSNTKAQIIEYYDKFISSMTSENFKLSFLNNNVKKYYRNFYLELTDFAIHDNFNDVLKNKYEEVLANIDIYIKAFDFLFANDGEWTVDDDGLKFEDPIILDEYLSVIEGLNKNKKNSETVEP